MCRHSVTVCVVESAPPKAVSGLNLADRLVGPPDSRRRRGRRHPFVSVLLIAASAVVAVAAVTVAGCSSGTSSDSGKYPATPTSNPPGSPATRAGGAPAALRYGLGPQTKCTVQSQPSAGSCHFGYMAAKEPLEDKTVPKGRRKLLPCGVGHEQQRC